MAASPIPVDAPNAQPQENWTRPDDQASNIAPPPSNGDAGDAANGAGHHSDDRHDGAQPAHDASFERTGSSAPEASSASATSKDASHRGEKQIKVLVESIFLTAVTPVFRLELACARICFNAQRLRPLVSSVLTVVAAAYLVDYGTEDDVDVLAWAGRRSTRLGLCLLLCLRLASLLQVCCC